MTADAEAIASVVGDLRIGRVRDLHNVGSYNGEWDDMASSVVIDIGDIFADIVLSEDHRPMALYDQLVPPPWRNAMLCYVNSFGNVMVTHVGATDVGDFSEQDRWVPDLSLAPEGGEPHEIAWDRVRWVLNASLWAGGTSSTTSRNIPTSGPLLLWSIAVYEDGTIADIRWTNFAGEEMEHTEWDNTLVTMLAAYNFLACRNVTVAEPVRRHRAERRRIERAGGGVVIHEIVVSPAGKVHPRPSELRPLMGSVAAHSVRGHFAEYGVGGKGLLFGKHSGRFWVPQHARGTSEVGEVEQQFRLTTDSVKTTAATAATAAAGQREERDGRGRRDPDPVVEGTPTIP